MDKKQRVLEAINGGRPDFVPTCFSLHFKKSRAFGAQGIASHLEFFKKTDTDVFKIMNENLVPYAGDIKRPEDWNKVATPKLTDKFINDQLEMTKRIIEGCDENAFFVGTLHGTVASAIHPIEDVYGYETVRELFCTHLRENPNPLSDAFKRLSEGMCRLAEKYIEIGMDGIYYAALGGEKYYFTDEEFEEYIAPNDKMVLGAVREAGGYNFLHMCKDKLNLERYRSYGTFADVVNWGVYDDNISLDEGKKVFPGSALMGGLENRGGVMVDGTDEELISEVRKVIEQQGKRSFILGADCTLATETDYKRIQLISRTARTL
jgi:uroporphyrinogen decarboxylase